MAITINKKTSDQVTELKQKRVDEHSLVKNKEGIVAQAVEALYKKEIK